jgi:ubiquitin carboxyl-terminal hydrolase 22/27/51
LILFLLNLLLITRCEVTSATPSTQEGSLPADPIILYDLFGTVNHIGNMQSGHYVTNIKVDDTWYHCNDAHISKAGLDDGEEAVLKNEGAYILFYIRR